MTLRRLLRALCLALLFLASARGAGPSAQSPVRRTTGDAPAPRLVIRSDDMGFSHGANAANQRLIESGLVVNVSVLFCAPWYREAVEILKRHPEVSVGVHLCANSEWKNYRWGPVAGRGRVPSLVDEEGHFRGSYRELNVEHPPRVEEMEIEFRAQIERALRSGLRIDYLDNHMGAGMHTPEQRAMVERLAREYGLGLSGSFGELRPGRFGGGGYEEQLARLTSSLETLAADSLYLIVFHVGTDTPELRAMQDLNENGAPNMSRQRQIELELLLSAEFRDALARNGIRPVSYRALAAREERGVACAAAGPRPATEDSAERGSVPRPDTAEVGEFSIPSVSPLLPAQLQRLRDLARSDPEACAIAEEVGRLGRPLLGAEPRPLAVVHYEGLVNTDPRRVATVERLREMGDVARLMRYWQVSADPRAAATLRRFVTAWARTYRPTGNDVNENKFYPLLVAYHALRGGFPEGERRRVDAWVESLGSLHAAAVESSTHFTNRYSKHVRLLAVAGLILGREDWRGGAHEGIRRFVTQSLHPDGSSEDLKRRDALSYHTSALRPVIELAMLSGEEGAALYRWTSPRGGSIRRSVEYVVPYALGEKTYAEWVHTTVDLDRRRAAAGLEKYQPGHRFDPQHALGLMEEASYFDLGLLRVVRHLTGSTAVRFPTWQTLVNEAARSASGLPASDPRPR